MDSDIQNESGAVLEIISPKKIDFSIGSTFTLKNEHGSILLRLLEQRQSGDAWVLKGQVVDAWMHPTQN